METGQTHFTKEAHRWSCSLGSGLELTQHTRGVQICRGQIWASNSHSKGILFRSPEQSSKAILWMWDCVVRALMSSFCVSVLSCVDTMWEQLLTAPGSHPLTSSQHLRHPISHVPAYLCTCGFLSGIISACPIYFPSSHSSFKIQAMRHLLWKAFLASSSSSLCWVVAQSAHQSTLGLTSVCYRTIISPSLNFKKTKGIVISMSLSVFQ